MCPTSLVRIAPRICGTVEYATKYGSSDGGADSGRRTTCGMAPSNSLTESGTRTPLAPTFAHFSPRISNPRSHPVSSA